MADESVKQPSIQRFAAFFRGYGISLGIILSAIPFATSNIRLLRMYESNRELLTFFTSLLSLLGVALLFAIRRRIGASVFPSGNRVLSRKGMRARNVWGIFVPSLFIVISVVSLIAYLGFLNSSISRAALEFARDKTGRPLSELLQGADSASGQLFGKDGEEAKVFGSALRDSAEGKSALLLSVHFNSEEAVDHVLRLTPSAEIPLHWGIEITYVLMFSTAALAFVWFGIIEYLQGELGLSDRDLLESPYRQAPDHQFAVDKVRDLDDDSAPLYFTLSYNPDEDPPKLISGPDGPFCTTHNTRLEYSSPGKEERTHIWSCRMQIKDSIVTLHTLTLGFDSTEIIKEALGATGGELASLRKLKQELEK